MNGARILLIATPAIVALTAPVASRSGGIYFTGITRSGPSCGQCHNSTPGAGTGFAAIDFAITPAARVVAGGQSISVTAAATGGQTASSLGGFAVDASAGTFSAGADTRTYNGGAAIGHSRATPGRSWSFGFTAPAAPGLVELYGVVNTVDGDGNNDRDDKWAFHGFDDTATVSTPVRLFVNAAGVAAVGSSCVGSFGNYPVLGAPTVPTLGNSLFNVQVHGAAPSSPVILLLGSSQLSPPVDLGFLGASGCFLHLVPAITAPAMTGPGNAQRGEGALTIPLPIPGRPQSLRGRTIFVQTIIVDAQNGRSTPITATNALAVTLR